jgi:hypothetical protein
VAVAVFVDVDATVGVRVTVGVGVTVGVRVTVAAGSGVLVRVAGAGFGVFVLVGGMKMKGNVAVGEFDTTLVTVLVETCVFGDVVF